MDLTPPFEGLGNLEELWIGKIGLDEKKTLTPIARLPHLKWV